MFASTKYEIKNSRDKFFTLCKIIYNFVKMFFKKN